MGYYGEFYGDRATQDLEVQYALEDEALCHRYGWPLEYVRNLDIVDTARLLGVIQGETRYREHQEREAKREQRKAEAHSRGRR